ncbi:hypothetical protein FACS1894132_05020 [Clostridia bacterium]|nr:hypothetical protein FACS1894132_05020 [Clostridia bacterium]
MKTNKIILVLCIFVLSFAVFAVNSSKNIVTYADTINCGDVDCDGSAGKIADVVLLGKHVSGKITLLGQNLINADCDLRSSSVDVADLQALIKFMLKQIAELPFGEPPTTTTTTSTTSTTTTTSTTITDLTSITPEPTVTSTELYTTTTEIFTSTETQTSLIPETSIPDDTFTYVSSTTPDLSTTTTLDLSTTTSEETTTTTTTTTITVTTTIFEPQVPLYQYIYGQWMNNSLAVIEERIGFSVNKDMEIPVYITALSPNNVVAQCVAEGGDFTAPNKPASRFRVQFNSYYFTYETGIPNPDGFLPNIGSTLSVEGVFAHEVTHGMTFASLPYSVLSNLPNWYQEGQAEAVVGNDRSYDFPPERIYSYTYKNKVLDGVATYEISLEMIKDFSNTSEDITCYYVGYLFMNWLDNYGSKSGQYTAQNGGRVKVLNSYLMQGQSFSNSLKSAFGNKTATTLISEFKAEAAKIKSYDDWATWANDKMNIQCNDGLVDSLCNTDALASDIIPNIGSAELISEVDTIIRNGYAITLKWGVG